jgi:hypothetical protein
MTLRNDKAVAAWAIMACWFAMLLVFTWLLVHDGPPAGTPPGLMAGILGLFWLFGLGGGSQIFAQRRYRLEVGSDGGARLSIGAPFRWERLHLRRGDIAGAELVPTKDSDGDPYFQCDLLLADGRRFPVSEGHDREDAEATLVALRRALGPGGADSPNPPPGG